MTIHWTEILLRLVLAAIFGAVIGAGARAEGLGSGDTHAHDGEHGVGAHHARFFLRVWGYYWCRLCGT